MNNIGRRQLLLGGGALGALGVAASLGVTIGLPACQRSSSDSPDRAQILADVTQIVIVPSYEDAATKAGALATAVEKLAATPDTASLAAAQDAWRTARTAWKRTDAFLFGPADDLAVTGGAIDSGPADVTKIAALIAGTTPIDDATAGSLGGNQRGFVGLEALLFDPARTNDAIAAGFAGAAGSIEDRRRALATSVAHDLRARIEAVRDAWLPAKGDYAGALTRAGRGSKVYSAERNGIDELVNGLANASEVLIALRLAKPLGLDQTPQAPHPELVESGISDASLADIAAVLEGIEMTYTATREGRTGVPLAAAVREFRPEADTELRKSLTAARTAVLAVPPPLRTAVTSSRDAAIAAHVAVRDVKRRIVTDVASTLGTTIGFGVTDGD
jgi:hypothetical protein